MSDFDWQAEARRIAAAFSVEDFRVHPVADPDIWGCTHFFAGVCHTKNELFAVEMALPKNWRKRKTPPQISAKRVEIKDSIVQISSLRIWARHEYSFSGWPCIAEFVIRGLYCLGYNTAQHEKLFDLTISAHERLEWQMQFRERLAKLEATP